MKKISIILFLTLLCFQGVCQAKPFTLQLLHFSDWEGGIDSVDNVVNFAALVDYMEDTHKNSILISAGDNYLSGPLLQAAGDPSFSQVLRDVYEDKYKISFSDLRVQPGSLDIAIANILDVDASALGNHEMDLGPRFFAALITPKKKNEAYRHLGITFPYLTSNIDFSHETVFQELYTNKILSQDKYFHLSDHNKAQKAKIAPATIVIRDNEKIGIVGVTTPYLGKISSLGKIKVQNPGAGTNNMKLLAEIVQPQIDRLVGQGVNKIILASHLQLFPLDVELASLLQHVDVIVSGGNDHRMADGEDRKRGLYTGDKAQGMYPIIVQDKDRKPTYIVSTDGHYKYLGRFVASFDEEGNIIPDSVDENISGAFATTSYQVASFYKGHVIEESIKAKRAHKLAEHVKNIVMKKDANIVGRSKVFLEGRREFVRTQSTNFGNLITDAFLEYAKKFDPNVKVAMTVGGSIRAPIGVLHKRHDGQNVFGPPGPNAVSQKKLGEVSQLDIESTLRFNNSLTLVTLTAGQLKEVLEAGVYHVGPGITYGGFPQVAGIQVQYDSQLTAGSKRIVNVFLEGENMPIVEDGQVLRPDRVFRIAVVNFLTEYGGDGYPFPEFIKSNPKKANFVNLSKVDTSVGQFDFAPPGTECDIVAEYFYEHYYHEPFHIEPNIPSQRVVDISKVRNIESN